MLKSKEIELLDVILRITLTLTILYLAFSPGINIPFYDHDTYKYSFGGMLQSCVANDAILHYGFVFTLGRPGTAYLDCLNFKLGSTLQSISYLRCVVILLVVLATTITSYLFRHISKLSKLTALFLSLSIFLLPAIQTAVIMAASYLIVAVILSLIAVLLTYRFLDSSGYTKYIFLITSILALLAAFYTYSSMTSIFVIIPLVEVLFYPNQEWVKIKRRIVALITVYGSCAFCYFLLVKLYLFNTGNEMAAPSGYQFHINYNLMERVATLYSLHCYLWSLFGNKLLYSMVESLLIIGVLCGARNLMHSALFKLTRKKATGIVTEKIIVSIVLVGLGNLTYLLQPSNIAMTRIIFGFQASMIVVLLWSVKHILLTIKEKSIEYWLPVGAMCFVMMGGYFANLNVTSTALNSNMEFNYIVSKLSEYLLKNSTLRRVNFIKPKETSFNGSTQTDIFNLNSTYYIDADGRGILQSALKELVDMRNIRVEQCIFLDKSGQRILKTELDCLKSPRKNAIVMTISNPGERIIKSPNTLVIDMNVLIPQAHPVKLSMDDFSSKYASVSS